MQITRVSKLTGVERTLEMDVTPEQLDAWTNGAFIQDACPTLTASEREFIKTGVTDEEWDAAFGEEE